jgi:hypothetical protein
MLGRPGIVGSDGSPVALGSGMPGSGWVGSGLGDPGVDGSGLGDVGAGLPLCDGLANAEGCAEAVGCGVRDGRAFPEEPEPGAPLTARLSGPAALLDPRAAPAPDVVGGSAYSEMGDAVSSECPPPWVAPGPSRGSRTVPLVTPTTSVAAAALETTDSARRDGTCDLRWRPVERRLTTGSSGATESLAPA